MAVASGNTPPVFLVDALPDGAAAVLDGPEAKHAATVRRMRSGQQLVLTDGAGGMVRCEVRAVTTGRQPVLELAVSERWWVPAPEPAIVVVQALVKGDRGELAVELATEAGADVIVPWQAERCVARWDEGPRGAKALARWRSTAREAAKQARRAWVPEIPPAVGTPELAELLASAGGGVLLDAEASHALTAASWPGRIPETGRLPVIIGPEGGITAAELDTLRDAGAVPARLGPTVLRASTAAAVALGALGALTGRWRDQDR